MSDIVGRLRSHAKVPGDLLNAAADEIERLRAELKRYSGPTVKNTDDKIEWTKDSDRQ